MATKTTNKKANKSSVEQIKNTSKEINNFIINTSEVIIDEALVKTTEWQGVADRAIKGGLKLTAKNQDLFFSALELMKGQLINGKERFKTIFSKN